MKMKDEKMILEMREAFVKLAQRNSANVEKYTKVRSIHQEIYNSMGNYIQKNNIDPRDVCEKACRDISLDLRDDHQNLLFLDLMIYPQYKDIKSLTETYLDKHILRKDEKVEMLKSMLESRFVAFTIIDRDESHALVEIEDFFTHDRIKLSDSGLGRFHSGRDIIFCGRLIQYRDICFQTGLNMPFKRNNVIKKWLKNHKNINEWTAGDILELEEFYQKYGYHAFEIR